MWYGLRVPTAITPLVALGRPDAANLRAGSNWRNLGSPTFTHEMHAKVAVVENELRLAGQWLRRSGSPTCSIPRRHHFPQMLQRQACALYRRSRVVTAFAQRRDRQAFVVTYARLAGSADRSQRTSLRRRYPQPASTNRAAQATTILTGIVVAVFAGLANINEVVELTNIGTLFAFVIVAAGIIVLRRKDPDRPRPFKTPFVPAVPILAILSCTYLMLELPLTTWDPLRRLARHRPRLLLPLCRAPQRAQQTLKLVNSQQPNSQGSLGRPATLLGDCPLQWVGATVG